MTKQTQVEAKALELWHSIHPWAVKAYPREDIKSIWRNHPTREGLVKLARKWLRMEKENKDLKEFGRIQLGRIFPNPKRKALK